VEYRDLKLRIEGMTCDSCAATVKRYLEQVDGVRDAIIDWKSGRGQVTYDPAKTDAEKILNSRAFRRQYTASALTD
jgi:copper chaperone